MSRFCEIDLVLAERFADSVFMPRVLAGGVWRIAPDMIVILVATSQECDKSRLQIWAEKRSMVGMRR